MTRLPLFVTLAALPLVLALPAQADPAADCASYGLSPGTDSYKSCVDALAEADKASAGAAAMPGAAAPPSGDAEQQRAQMRADMERQRAAMQKDMDAKMKAAQHPADGSPSKCVTTVNGTNTSTSCP
jgi:hypothetical protein